MIELTYRRCMRKNIKVGLGQPSPLSQVPEGVRITDVDKDNVATLLFPIERKRFSSEEEADDFIDRFQTKSTRILEVSRENLVEA